MPKRRHFFLALGWVGVPLLSFASQSSMKMLALATGTLPFGNEWLAAAAHSPWVYALIASEILSFLLWMHILSHIDVSRAVPLTSVSYILILCAAPIIFHENVTLFQLFGAILILSGVWFISTAPKEQDTKL